MAIWIPWVARRHRTALQRIADRSSCCQTSASHGYHQDYSPDRTFHGFLLTCGFPGSGNPSCQDYSSAVKSSKLRFRKKAPGRSLSVTLGSGEGPVHHMFEHGNERILAFVLMNVHKCFVPALRDQYRAFHFKPVDIGAP